MLNIRLFSSYVHNDTAKRTLIFLQHCFGQLVADKEKLLQRNYSASSAWQLWISLVSTGTVCCYSNKD